MNSGNKKMRIGIIGCGVISDVYTKNLHTVFLNTTVTAVTDIFLDRAEKLASKYGIKHVYSTNDELINSSDVDIVLILTQPDSHHKLIVDSLNAGKHVYVEKPLALTTDEAKELFDLSKEKGLYLSAAPDTIFIAAYQTAKKLVDDGWIGEPIGATCAMSFIPPETWHADPDFLYKKGAGPLYDNAPYSLLSLTYFLGPVATIQCAAKTTYKQRKITSQPHYGEIIDVEVPTYLQSVITFKNGAIASLLHSVDSPLCKVCQNGFEIYGTKGMLCMPVPGTIEGILEYKRNDSKDWIQLPILSKYDFDIRGIGTADMAKAIVENREPRLSKDWLFHISEAMDAMNNAWQTRNCEIVESSFTPTPIIPLNNEIGEI